LNSAPGHKILGGNPIMTRRKIITLVEHEISELRRLWRSVPNHIPILDVPPADELEAYIQRSLGGIGLLLKSVNPTNLEKQVREPFGDVS
jgi:hypothetical protein